MPKVCVVIVGFTHTELCKTIAAKVTGFFGYVLLMVGSASPNQFRP